MAKGGGGVSGNTVRPARHLRAQSSAYGDPIMIFYGETLVEPNIIWTDNFRSHRLPSGTSSGKKSGGFAGIVSFIYSVHVMFCLGEGGTATAIAPNGNDTFNLGLMRPGGQVVSVKEARTPIDTADPEDFSSGGKAQKQKLTGVEPGVKKGKRVWYAGYGKFGKFRGARFIDFLPSTITPTATYRFLTLPLDDVTEVFSGAFFDSMTTPDNEHYAPDQYRGFVLAVNRRMNLGANASIPNMGFPAQGLKKFWEVDLALGVGPQGYESEVRDAAPDRIIADQLVNVKHGGGWDRHPQFLPGYDAGLPNPLLSPFWNDGNAASYGAACRALGLLISPRISTQTPLQQLLDDLCLITDAAPLWSEGLLKIIPWGSVAASRIIAGTTFTFTPSTDATSTYPGANIAIRDTLALDDFIAGPVAKDDPCTATRKGPIPDQQNTSGYFNVVRVEFESRVDGYVKKTVEAKDRAGVQVYGLIARETITAPAITREELAEDVAIRILQRFGDKRIDYKLTVGWWFLHWEPMDLVVIPGASISADMTGQLITIRLISWSENEKGEREWEAEKFPKTIPAAPATVLPDPEDETDGSGILLGTTISGNAGMIGLSGLTFGDTDFGGLATGDPSNADEAAALVFDHADDVNITELSMHMHGFIAGAKVIASVPPPGIDDVQDGSAFNGTIELYWNVDGVRIGDGPLRTLPILKWVIASYRTKGTLPGTEVWWNPNRSIHIPELDVQKVWRGVLEVPAGSRVCLEVRTLGAGGEVLTFDSVTEHPSEFAFDWQLGWEVA